MIPPEATFRHAQHVSGGVAGIMVGHRLGEHHVEPGVSGSLLDLFTPVGVDLTGQIDGKTHGLISFFSVLHESLSECQDAATGRYPKEGPGHSGFILAFGADNLPIGGPRNLALVASCVALTIIPAPPVLTTGCPAQ
mgnify:FL=1